MNSKKVDTMRIQVNLSRDMVRRIDAIAQNIGVNRSAYLATMIGQQVAATEQVMSAARDVLGEAAKKSLKE